MLHLQDLFVTFQVFKSDIIVLLEQFFENLLLVFVLLFELVVLFSESIISHLQLFVDSFYLYYLFLFGANLLLNLSLVFLLLFVELASKVFRVLLGLIQEVRVLDLKLVAFLVEVKLSLLHCFFMLLFQLLDLICVAGMQSFNLVSDGIITLDLKINFVLMVLLKLINLFFVSSLFALEFIRQILVLFQRILNVGVFDLLVCLKGQLVLLLQGFYLLAINNI